MTGLMGILSIVMSVVVWVIYHKMFVVVYRDVQKGIGKEIVMSLLIGVILTVLMISFWWISALLIMGGGLALAGKAESPDAKKTIMIGAVVLAVVFSIISLVFKNSLKEDSTSNNDTAYQENTSYTNDEDSYNIDYSNGRNTYATENNTDTEYEEQSTYEESEYKGENEIDYIEEGVSNNNSSFDTSSDNITNIDTSFDFVDDKITEEDLIGLSAKKLTYLRNLIFAEHNYVFKSQELTSEFSQFVWYTPDPDAEVVFFGYEKENAEFIKAYQDANDLNYTPQ